MSQDIDNIDEVEDEDEPQIHHCPMCDGPGTIMGALGNKLWFRCRDCGIDFSEEAN